MGRGRPRNLSLSAVQRQVLWMLQEAHEETLPTVVATLRAHFSDLTAEEVRAKAIEAVTTWSAWSWCRLLLRPAKQMQSPSC
jgi:hypothetical protein